MGCEDSVICWISELHTSNKIQEIILKIYLLRYFFTRKLVNYKIFSSERLYCGFY